MHTSLIESLYLDVRGEALASFGPARTLHLLEVESSRCGHQVGQRPEGSPARVQCALSEQGNTNATGQWLQCSALRCHS